ncbi:hypothetical protein OIO90_002983 [Microbotryomycetes sp. JL221]|nr:hypothetical protein OIO90_002983 [Microbotryomycetes sp. JL221]
MTNSTVQQAAFVAIVSLFPQADPHFIRGAVQHHADAVVLSGAPRRRQSATEGDRHDIVKHVVARVVHKLLEINFDEYPRIVRADNTTQSSRKEVHIVNGDREPSSDTATRQNSSNIMTDAVKELGAGSGGTTVTRGENVVEPVDVTLTRNMALIQLFEMFPLAPVIELRQTIVSNESKYILYSSVEDLLRRPTTSSPSRQERYPLLNWFQTLFNVNQSERKEQQEVQNQQQSRRLNRHDLFKTQAYNDEMIRHCKALYPHVNSDMIVRKAIVEQPKSYETLREELDELERKARLGWRTKFKKWFDGGAVGDRRGVGVTIRDSELELQVRNFNKARERGITNLDEDEARKLNRYWTDKRNLLTCECCFDDEVTFEDVVVCESGQHFMCRECVQRQITSHVLGETKINPNGHVQCLSTSGCQNAIARQELERSLDKSLMIQFDRRMAASQLHTSAGDLKIIQCPFCPYAEIELNDSPWSRAFPTFYGSQSDMINIFIHLIVTLKSCMVLLLIVVPLVFVGILATPDQFVARQNNVARTQNRQRRSQLTFDRLFPMLEPVRAFELGHSFVGQIAQQMSARKHGRRTIFECRNTRHKLGHGTADSSVSLDWTRPRQTIQNFVEATWEGQNGDQDALFCGRLSCLTCHKLIPSLNIASMHTCFPETDSLRLSIELARTEAVKRTCPSYERLGDKGILIIANTFERAANKAREEWLRRHPNISNEAVDRASDNHLLRASIRADRGIFDAVDRWVTLWIKLIV